MEQERVRIAEINFKKYIDEGKIVKTRFDELIYRTYLKNALESLNVANQIFTSKSSALWTIVASYYSMFYISCAYLYKLGYKPKEEIVHQVVNESIIVLLRHKLKNHLLDNYSEEKDKALVISDNYLDNYEREKMKRANFQYETTEEIKYSKAQTSLDRAKEFVELVREILS